MFSNLKQDMNYYDSLESNGVNTYHHLSDHEVDEKRVFDYFDPRNEEIKTSRWSLVFYLKT